MAVKLKSLGLKLWLHEWVMLAYLALTLMFMFLSWDDLVNPTEMFKTRAIALGALGAGLIATKIKENKFTRYLRVALVLFTLSVWYPDTYEFSRLYPSMDHIFAQWDHDWFGCQPSLRFSQILPQWWASELFYLGYFSYFPMIYMLVTWVAFRKPDYLLRTTFVILTAFFLYYLIYMFIPAAGPQYYYQVAGVDPVNGVFPEVGRYFSEHQDFYPMPGGEGPFHYLVELTHQAGERPTAAFPSSHIGISTILMLLCRKYRMKGLFCVYVPFYLLLCGATVYIHAHYLVDAIFGFVSAFFAYWVVSRMWENLNIEDSSENQ